ncbi:MAG: hypothetical protein R3290_09645 [Acidimicrobiia bacterium]|nr:hypothetical protein [Acidimicrobiia bacterium]
MHVTSITFAYPHADGSVRADLARRLLSGSTVDGSFVLSTCLRTEVVVAGDDDRLDETLEQVFGGPVPVGEGIRRRGEHAVRHLFRVAAGLESPILGELEVLTQFRQALVAAEDAGRIEGLFVKLLETAVSTGRQARDLLPGSPHDSMAAVAAQVVGGHDRVVVLGSGIMATAVVMGLGSLPAPPEILVVARSPEKVSIEGVEVWPFDRAAEALAGYPAAVSATSAKRRPVDDDEMATLLSRRSEPLTLVDMAMPPDFAPPEGAPVEYVDIDDLARMAHRRPRSEEADAMVDAAAAEAYRGVVDHQAVGPVIGGLVHRSDTLVDEIVERFGGRLGDEADRPVVRQAVHTALRTLLADPISYLRSAERADDAADVIAEAFGLDDG